MDNQTLNNNPTDYNNPNHDTQPPTPINDKQKTPIIVAIIPFCVLALFIILAIIIIIQPKTNNFENGNNISNTEPTEKNTIPIEIINYEPIEKTNKKPITSLTKEEAIEAYKESHSFGYIPSDSLPSALRATDCMPTYNLLESYETDDDINDYVSSPVTPNVEKVESVSDYYVVITHETTAKQTKQPMCVKNIMFNNAYFSYGYEYGYDESGNGPYRKFVDYSSNVINAILPVLALTEEGHPTLYDYDIQEDDNYITINMYSIGIRDEASNNGSASIIFRTQYYRFDKTTKEVGLLRGDKSLVSGMTKIDSKVVPISEDELKELKEYAY